MTAPWWGRERNPWTVPRLRRGSDPFARTPVLLPHEPGAVEREILERAPAFTPDWTNRRALDAGVALVDLFDDLTSGVTSRVNRLPEKTFVEFLLAAGVRPGSRRPARTALVFTASPAAPAAVLVPEGFACSAKAADGSSDLVFFETTRSLFVTPAVIERALVQEGDLFQEVDLGAAAAERFLPLGARPRPGAAWLIGLTAEFPIGASFSLGIEPATADATPAPAVSGGFEASTGASAKPDPLLRWELFDGGAFHPFEIVRDETRALQQSGVVELVAPDSWRPGLPAGVSGSEPLRWLRVRLAHGSYDAPPRLSLFQLNRVPALAVRTFRDEVLDPVPGTGRRRMRLAQTPVLPDTLELFVTEGGAAPFERWDRVDDLAVAGGSDLVYELDAERGELAFGDGVHGARLPDGFRNVQARRYQVGGGAAGNVAADEVTTLVQSVPFLTGVTNPIPAAGGRDEEPDEVTWRKGPERIRARGRAVTTADYALAALDAEGAEVSRAHAVSAMDPRFPRAVIPGCTSVFLLSTDREERPPIPTAATLARVASYLHEQVAPAGAQVVTSAPRFHEVSVRARLSIREGADTGEAVRLALTAVDGYLHPLYGGEQGRGWPFGGTLVYQALVRRLLARVPALRAVASLSFVVDGIALDVCQDFTPAPNALLWPGAHEMTPDEEAAS